MAPRPSSDVVESSSESKDLSLLDSSTSGAGLGAIASFVPSKDDEEQKGIRILPRKEQPFPLASFDNTLHELLGCGRNSPIDENLEARLADDETSPFHDMPDLIPYSESTGTNTPVLQPEGDEGVHDFTQEDFGLYAWFESRYVYSMHSLFHHYVTNCHFTGINQIEPFRFSFQVTPSGGVELMSWIRPGCLV